METSQRVDDAGVQLRPAHPDQDMDVRLCRLLRKLRDEQGTRSTCDDRRAPDLFYTASARSARSILRRNAIDAKPVRRNQEKTHGGENFVSVGQSENRHGVNGVFLQAFAVEEFQPVETFYDRVDELIAFIKSTPRAPGFDKILLPGESGRRREAESLRTGVEVDDATWSELTGLAAEMGVDEVPQTRLSSKS